MTDLSVMISNCHPANVGSSISGTQRSKQLRDAGKNEVGKTRKM